MDLRGSIWTILSDLASKAEGIILDPRTSIHDGPKVTRFANDLQNLAEGMLRSTRRARPSSLTRQIDALKLQCVGPLSAFAEPLDRAARRVESLKKRRRPSGSVPRQESVLEESSVEPR